MATVKFATTPNTRNALREPSTLSACGCFRLTEIAGITYAHTRRKPGEHWEPVREVAFFSRSDAIAACRAVGVPEKKRTRRVKIHADAV